MLLGPPQTSKDEGLLAVNYCYKTLQLRRYSRSWLRLCYKKKVFLKFRNFHRKTLVLESLFNKAAGLKACNFIKKRLQHRCFPVNIAKFLRTFILKNICERLLLKLYNLA